MGLPPQIELAIVLRYWPQGRPDHPGLQVRGCLQERPDRRGQRVRRGQGEGGRGRFRAGGRLQIRGRGRDQEGALSDSGEAAQCRLAPRRPVISLFIVARAKLRALAGLCAGVRVLRGNDLNNRDGEEKWPSAFSWSVSAIWA